MEEETIRMREVVEVFNGFVGFGGDFGILMEVEVGKGKRKEGRRRKLCHSMTWRRGKEEEK